MKADFGDLVMLAADSSSVLNAVTHLAVLQLLG